MDFTELTNPAMRWCPIDPSRFRVGQIVQLEVAFRVVPTALKSTYRMVPLIRSIALLDSELYTVSNKCQHTYNWRYTDNRNMDAGMAAESQVNQARIQSAHSI